MSTDTPIIISDLPADKSILQRILLLFPFLDEHKIILEISGPVGEDVQACLSIIQQFGIHVLLSKNSIVLTKLHRLMKDSELVLNCRNSGTCARLVLGLLCGAKICAVLYGDESLSSRPMERVLHPLKKMGGKFEYLGKAGCLPIRIIPSELQSATISLSIPSAQVKSAVLFAAFASNISVVIQGRTDSRDHSERLFQFFGLDLKRNMQSLVYLPNNPAKIPEKIRIPSDISSAAFLIITTLLIGKKTLRLDNVGLNNSRIEYLNILKNMNANLDWEIQESKDCPEVFGKILVQKSILSRITIYNDQMPMCIDELPVLALAAAASNGESIFENVSELRVKESDRMQGIYEVLQNFGKKVSIEKDNIIISGDNNWNEPNAINYHKDHRMFMMYEIARSLAAKNKREIIPNNAKIHEISYPNFFSHLSLLLGNKNQQANETFL